MKKKLLYMLLAAMLATTMTACGDAPGEDEVGDGEVNDEE